LRKIKTRVCKSRRAIEQVFAIESEASRGTMRAPHENHPLVCAGRVGGNVGA
jgi:hypothetical protein